MSRDVPEGWTPVRLGALVEIERASFSINEINSFDSVRLYSLPAFDSGAVPEKTAGSEVLSNKYRVPTDCILFSKLNPRIPRVWRVKHEHREPALGSTEFWPLTPRKGNVDLDFLTSFLTSADFLNSPEITPASSTNSHQRVDRKAFENFEMLLPPLYEQRRIAEILSSVEEAIAATRAVIEQTRKVKQGVLERLLTKGIGHTRFKQTEIGEIPEGWEVLSLGDLLATRNILAIQDGNHGELHPVASDYKTKGIPFVMARDLVEGSIDVQNCAFISEDQAASLRVGKSLPGDVLITHKGTIGRVAVTPEEPRYIMLTPQVTLYRVNPAGSVLADYIRYVFENEPFQSAILRISDQSTRKYVGLIEQKRLKIAIPDAAEQRKICTIAEEFSKVEQVHSESMRKLLAFKSDLMSDLLTGRKRVTGALPLAAE